MNKARSQLQKRRKAAEYQIDDVTYKSKALYEFHVECKNAVSKKTIKSFEVPKKLSTKSRYTTYKPVIDGIQFDSLMEGRFYIFLMSEKQKHSIDSFEMQVPYILQERFKKNGKTYRPIEYVADFVIHKDNKTRVIDIKGKLTELFKLKKKLFEAKFPDLSLEEIQYCPEKDSWLTLDEIKKINRKRSTVGK